MIATAARDLDSRESAVRNWVRQAEAEAGRWLQGAQPRRKGSCAG